MLKKENLDIRLTEDSVEIIAKFEAEGEKCKFIKLSAKIQVKDSIAKFEK